MARRTGGMEIFEKRGIVRHSGRGYRREIAHGRKKDVDKGGTTRKRAIKQVQIGVFINLFGMTNVWD